MKLTPLAKYGTPDRNEFFVFRLLPGKTDDEDEARPCFDRLGRACSRLP